jgi:hypothetical protein
MFLSALKNGLLKRPVRRKKNTSNMAATQSATESANFEKAIFAHRKTK